MLEHKVSFIRLVAFSSSTHVLTISSSVLPTTGDVSNVDHRRICTKTVQIVVVKGEANKVRKYSSHLSMPCTEPAAVLTV